MKKLIEAIKKALGMDKKSSDSSSQGFTLIELLVVIAVIGVLAAAVLIAIDPLQQLARGRDSGRKSSVSQVGNAVQAFYTANSAFPTVAQWTAATNILVSSGEIKLFPTQPGGTSTACTNNNINNYCYRFTATDFVIYTSLESESELSKCAAATPFAWFTYSSSAGRAGLVCTANSSTEPAVGVTPQ